MATRNAGQSKDEPHGQRSLRLSCARTDHQPAGVEFRQLRCFAVVAGKSHFGRAAACDLTSGVVAPVRTP